MLFNKNKVSHLESENLNFTKCLYMYIDRKGSRRTLPEFLTEEIVRRGVGMLRRQL